MASGSLALLKTRRFWPLFWTQFLGAFNDNFFKQAMGILIAYRIGASAKLDTSALIALAGATFVAPSILISALAGRMADTIDKAKLARWLKLWEIVLMVLAAIALVSANLVALFAVLFLLGCQSALFGPVKYGLLPDHLRDDELVQGNALIECGTFVAILVGSLLGGALIAQSYGIAAVSAGLIVFGAIGYATARFVPPAPPHAHDQGLSFNFLSDTVALIKEARQIRPVWLSILGISWFWTIGATLFAVLPAIARDHLGGAETVTSFFLAVFSVGIGTGSMLCAKRLNGEITARTVPFAALAISILLFIFANVIAALPTPQNHTQDILGILGAPHGITVILFLLALSVIAGFYVVPLYAILQHEAPDGLKARMIGANNVVNSLMTLAGAAVTAVLTSVLHLPVPVVMLVLALLNLIAVAIILKLLSRLVLKTIARTILGTLFRVEVRGYENFAKATGRRIVIANHQSFIDAAVVAAFMPGDPTFAVNTQIAKRWWVRPLLYLVDFAPIDPTNPMALKTLAREVENGRTLVIFPEGRLTTTGSLMKVYDGPGLVADKTGAEIISVRLDGPQHTYFTFLKDRVARRLMPKVRMTVLPPSRLKIDPTTVGRARRRAAGLQLYDMMSETLFLTTNIDKTLFTSLADAARLNGRRRPIIEDTNFTPMSYGRLLAGSFVLGRKLNRLTKDREIVGVLLPNSAAAVTTFFALQAFRRVPAMLNPSAGLQGILSACQTAEIRTVISAHRFAERAKLVSVLQQLEAHVKVIYLDDFQSQITIFDKIAGLICSFAPKLFARQGKPEDPAVVLFTSGSEGTPKGVVLSHRNIEANRNQIASRIAFNAQDIVFNALPMFHSFGLTVGTLLPILSGIRTFLYPSPLHYRIVPELVYQTNATVFFGTDTFLRGYARVANPYDFHALRLVGSGAEKVTDETRRVWTEKFGLRILEGYGATETSPVIAFNTTMHSRYGTVGRLMPNIEARVEPVPGIERGGRLFVKGPNVMLGYLRATAPGQIEPVKDGWYDTGDIVSFDQDGYLTIQGRAKRFAKVAGEMVSLAAIEELAATISPSYKHAAVVRPDSRKGEQILLVTEDPAMTRNRYAAAAKQAGVAEIMWPRDFIYQEKLPVLPTGKTDYPGLEKLVLAQTATAVA
jgi:acyl-[acyl-carrier-protein]-phospholipid O-acyltransferase / long-chain-fatty-acid--[acyl-carrier-protein] ligase